MRRGRPPHPELLTPRQQEVLELLRQGLSNQEIAERLGIGVFTARYHVSEILARLDVESRREAAQWQPEPEPALRRRAFFGVAIPAFFLDKSPLEVAMKIGGIAAIAGTTVALALLAIGVTLTSSSQEDAAAQEAERDSPWPEQPPPGIRYSGAYRLISPEFSGTPEHEPFDTGIDDPGPVASNLAEARQSSLFPPSLPEGYEVTDAHSAGEPSELYLELTIRGEEAEYHLTLRRPDVMPLDIHLEDDFDTLRPQLHGTSGVYLPPLPGDEDRQPGVIYDLNGGISSRLSAIGLDPVPGGELQRYVAFMVEEANAPSRWFPELPPPDQREPRPEDITMTGPCEMDLHLSPRYLSQATNLRLDGLVQCEGLDGAQLCSDEAKEILGPDADAMAIACDEDDEMVRSEWRVWGGVSTCRFGNPTVIEGNDLVAGMVPRGIGCDIIINWVPDREPIEVCVDIAGRETCAEFEYTRP